jgi:hypothetical protein
MSKAITKLRSVNAERARIPDKIIGGSKVDRPVSTGVKKNFIIDGKTVTRTVYERQNGRHTKVIMYGNKWHLVSSLKIIK